MSSPSKAPRVRKPSTPCTLLSIPLEIRQYILSYAFVEAVTQDIAFNAKLRPEIPSPGLTEGLFPKNCDSDMCPYDPTPEVPGKSLEGKRPPCAPRIYALANKISEVHPQLKEEVKFVFKQCLEQFRS